MKPGGDFEQMQKFHFSSQTPNLLMKKLRSGFLLKDILDRSKRMEEVQSPQPLKLVLYFAHDMNLVHMLSSLGFFTVGTISALIEKYTKKYYQLN